MRSLLFTVALLVVAAWGCSGSGSDSTSMSMPTPRRIALINATMQQDVADLNQQGQAVVNFYNHLTPDQQAIFDRVTLASATDQSQPH